MYRREMRMRETDKTDAAYVTRSEALRILTVKPATLYTYVSRGWIRRIADRGRRPSLYLREDVDRVRGRSNARAAAGIVAGGAMRYGEPIVPTSITAISAEGPIYRARGAVALADAGVEFEVVAELLWSGRLLAFRPWRLGSVPGTVRTIAGELGRSRTSVDLHDAFALVTVAAGMATGSVLKQTTAGATPALAARQLILLLSGCFGFLTNARGYRAPRAGESVAQAIARSLGVTPSPAVTHALNAALVLSADHELNPATFVARVAASSESSLNRCVAAAICTNAGERIAQGCNRLEQFVRGPEALRAPVFRSGAAPLGADATAKFGFNHPLYPNGDPRGRWLLQMIRNSGTRSSRLRTIFNYIDTMQGRHKQHPRFELALALLTTTLRLPPGAAGGIYTLGRVAGWVAHISEQRLAGFLIRPRAKFIGTIAE
jgi:citrate synthase